MENKDLLQLRMQPASIVGCNSHAFERGFHKCDWSKGSNTSPRGSKWRIRSTDVFDRPDDPHWPFLDVNLARYLGNAKGRMIDSHTTMTPLLLLLSLCALLSLAVAFNVDPNPSTQRLRPQRAGSAASLSSTSSLGAAAGASGKKDLFEMEGWPPIKDDLNRIPIFCVATKEGNPLAYKVNIDEAEYTIPFFYCDVNDALKELDGAKNNTSLEGLDILPFPLGKAFEMWCKDEAVIVPSLNAVMQAGAPPGTNPVGQQVPMFACMEIMEEDEETGSAKLPLFMALEDANDAVKAAVDADGGAVGDFDVVCLSLSGAVEQIATIPETPGFHFVPPMSSMQYISEYLS